MTVHPQLPELCRALPDPFLLLDARGQVIACSAAAGQLLGRPEEELVGRRISQLAARDPGDQLRLWARNAQAIPGVLFFSLGDETLRFPCTGQRLGGTATGLVLVSFARGRNVRRPFALLRERLDERDREIVRRKAVQAQLGTHRDELDRLQTALVRMHRLGTGLAAAVTTEQVGSAFVEDGVPAVGASRGVLFSREEDGAWLELVASVGQPEGLIREPGLRLPTAGATPPADVVRTGTPLFVESLEAFRARYPEIVARHADDLAAAFALLPLFGKGGCIGAVALGYSERRTFTPAERELMLALASQCALALERSRLFEAQRRARLEAEEERRRSAFLAEASARLADSLDVGLTLETLAKMAVPTLASFCIIEGLETLGPPSRLAINHVDPQMRLLAQAYRRCSSLDGAGYGVTDAVRSGHKELWSDFDAFLQSSVPSTQRRELLARFGVRELLALPLRARNRILGGVLLMQTCSDRSFAPRDIETAEELARRAAVALDNAHLFREAETAQRRKDEFLAVLGHELRNPLAPITTALHLMRLKDSDGFAREREVIERQSRHLQTLVDDLLDLSRITRGKIELQKRRHELADSVARAIEMVTPLLEQRSHALVVDVPRDGSLLVDADPGRLAQIAANLINNAAKYTEAGGRIEIRGGRVGNRIELRVRDNGMGIEPDVLPHVFEAFMQNSRSRPRAQGGLGVGLALVKKLAELHGGTVVAQSEGPGRGSEFTVHLPAAGAETRERRPGKVEPPSHVAMSSTTGPRILVVDDNVDAAQLLAAALQTMGYQARPAFEPAAALEIASQWPPDLAILDIGLPGIDGYELASRLRELGRPMIFVALTGYGQETDRARSKAAGFEEHLVKPVELERLRAILERVVPQPSTGSESPS